MLLADARSSDDVIAFEGPARAGSRGKTGGATTGGGGGGTGSRQRTRRKSEFRLQEETAEAAINLGVQAGERIAPVSNNAETKFNSNASGSQQIIMSEVWVEASDVETKRKPSLILEGVTPGGSSATDEPHMDGLDLVC